MVSLVAPSLAPSLAVTVSLAVPVSPSVAATKLGFLILLFALSNLISLLAAPSLALAVTVSLTAPSLLSCDDEVTFSLYVICLVQLALSIDIRCHEQFYRWNFVTFFLMGRCNRMRNCPWRSLCSTFSPQNFVSYLQDVGVAEDNVASNAASVILLGYRLSHIVDAISLAKATMARVHQNLASASAYNVVAILIAVGVLLSKYDFIMTHSFFWGIDGIELNFRR